jgi:hypothetical protein
LECSLDNRRKLFNYSVDISGSSGNDGNGGHSGGSNTNNPIEQHNYVSTNITGAEGGFGHNSGGSNWATATLGFIAMDIAIPEPTDAAWPKWAGYAIAGGISAAYLYSGDYIAKMNREIDGIMRRTMGPPGFVYELVATKNGYYPNLNTGVPTYLKVGETWKFGETTKGFGRYPDNKIDLVRDNLKMIPLPPGGNQLQIKIQEKYLIYGYFILHGHRPAGNPIFR